MQVEVRSGDTLDTLLRRVRVAEGRLARATDEVVDLNDLDTGALTPGRMIDIPDEFVPPSVRERYAERARRASAAGPTTNDATGSASVALRVLTARARPQSNAAIGQRVDRPIPLTPDLQGIVGDADEVLNLRHINSEFNPLKETIGRFKAPSELFQGKAFVDVASIVEGSLQAVPEPVRSAIAPLVGALGDSVVLRTPAQQYNVHDGGLPGNRIVFYGGSVQHAHLDKLVEELGRRHLRLIKQMAHFNYGTQGGSIERILTDGVGGVTHAGGLSAGHTNGLPTSIKSDWPSDYGALDEDNVHYNANLIAIDYAAGARDPIPEEYLAAYKRNADMWDCFAGALVPFTNDDPDERYQDYEYNPLEIYDQASAQSVARDLAQLDRNNFLNNHGAFYCAEGQYCVANLGPNALIKRSLYGDTPMGRMIDKFQEAPGVSREHPEIGWAHLRDAGLIDEEQYAGLESTNRLGAYLEWIPEDVKPWTAFRPYEKEGLIAKPMTVATMAWGLIRNYLPREGLAKVIADEIQAAFKAAMSSGNAAVAEAVTALAGGHDPRSPEGQAALSAYSLRAATGFIVHVLKDESFRGRLLAKAGFEEITNEDDKARVRALYDRFVATVANPDLRSQADFDRAIRALDDEFSSLVVERESRNPATGELMPAKKQLMVYAAPQCYGFWAQEPGLFGDSAALRYVATAMHAEQAKRGVLPTAE